MATRTRLPVHRLHTGQKLVLIFAASVLLPGVVLAYVGLRSLLREDRRIEEDVRENLKAVAELIGSRLESELEGWRRTLDELVRASDANSVAWPAGREDGSAVALLRQKGQIRVVPPEQLLFSFQSTRETLAERVAEIEPIELRAKDLDQAIAMYRELVATSAAPARAAALHRLARTLKKGGQAAEALRAFRMLESEPPVLLGSLPSDLVGGYEALMLQPAQSQAGGALRFYERLVGGRWRLEKASYAFYSERLLRMLPESESVRHWRQVEHRKLALSLAVESYLDNPRAVLLSGEGYWLALSRDHSAGAIVLGERLLRSLIWPAVFREARTKAGFALLTQDRRLLYGRIAAAEDAPLVRTELRTLPSMLLEVWPADPEAAFAGRRRQQNLYAATLGMVVLLLALGVYLSIRSVRTELRVAQLKEEFVATVSHEFRSPLAGLTQLGEMLRDGRVADERSRRRYHELIVAETRRLRRLVENVLDFSRIQNGRKRYHLAPFAAAPWLHEIVEEAQSTVTGADILINASIPEDLPVIVGDREALSTAVQNLLDNAVKYSGDSKVVELAARPNGLGLAISVRDRGVGIKDEDKPHVFEKFYRGSGETSRNVKGAGLGLSLVKHIVAAHGGSVALVSSLGEGSLFIIELKTGK